MATTSITFTQIETLLAEAAEAGDLVMVAVCGRALEGDEAARAECGRVIAAARAMDDELTAEYGDQYSGWSVVDSSGQRFWPATVALTAEDAAEAGRGKWVY